MPGKEDTYAYITAAQKSSSLTRQQIPLGLVGRTERRDVTKQGHPIPRERTHDTGRLAVGV